ncbi:hypothetical protein D3C81_954540 [compost metagenome]
MRLAHRRLPALVGDQATGARRSGRRVRAARLAVCCARDLDNVPRQRFSHARGIMYLSCLTRTATVVWRRGWMGPSQGARRHVAGAGKKTRRRGGCWSTDHDPHQQIGPASSARAAPPREAQAS